MHTATRARPIPTLRRALEADLEAIVRLFALPDEGNKKNEDPGPPVPACYREALRAIERDPDNAQISLQTFACDCGAFAVSKAAYQ